MTPLTPDADTRRRILAICRQEPRYAPEAYAFVQAGVSYTQTQLNRAGQAASRHISGAQLLHGLRSMAIEEFGPMARTVLAEWGITATLDFGRIVFLMVEHHLLGAQESDKLADFEHVYDFAEAFDRPFLPATPPAPPTPIDG
jgi:uncharacterized repeat protein (TIGR04138 family)